MKDMNDFDAINRILNSDYSGLGFDTTEDILNELEDHLDATAMPDHMEDEQE